MQIFVFSHDTDLHLCSNKSLGLINSYIMTSPKGMDEFFWGKEFENILDWIERLEMAFEVHGYDEVKKFKIEKFNLHGKARDWFKKLQPTLAYWNEMKIIMQQKLRDVDLVREE